MCLICIDIMNLKMTLLEAERNTLELLPVLFKKVGEGDAKEKEEFDHVFDLADSIRRLDIEKLEETLEEGKL